MIRNLWRQFCIKLSTIDGDDIVLGVLNAGMLLAVIGISFLVLIGLWPYSLYCVGIVGTPVGAFIFLRWLGRHYSIEERKVSKL
jgi:hypothetical protein